MCALSRGRLPSRPPEQGGAAHADEYHCPRALGRGWGSVGDLLAGRSPQSNEGIARNALPGVAHGAHERMQHARQSATIFHDEIARLPRRLKLRLEVEERRVVAPE